MSPGRMWEVNSQELRLTDQVIGKGSFCSVVKGIFNGAVVAVRTAAPAFPPKLCFVTLVCVQVKLPHNMQAITEQVRKVYRPLPLT